VLVILTLIWKRVTRGESYQMADLLPTRKQFRWLLVPAALMYLGMGVLIRPDWYPGVIGHLMIWILYGVSFYLLSRSIKIDWPQKELISPKTWSDRNWLLLGGIFPLAALVGEVLTSPFSDLLALIFWFGGIIFGLVMFMKALRMTISVKKDLQHV
jgi:hypothetical protein